MTKILIEKPSQKMEFLQENIDAYPHLLHFIMAKVMKTKCGFSIADYDILLIDGHPIFVEEAFLENGKLTYAEAR